ncbi:MAG: family finger-like protein [Planctomycetota bacterium]|nr:family finger-like protein [Planctomycetota bacterium]
MARLAKIFCPNCPRELQIRPEHLGRRVACKYCDFRFRVPRHVLIPCPSCGEEGTVRTDFLGRKIRCKHCGHVSRAKLKASPAPKAGAEQEIQQLRARLERRELEIKRIAQQLQEARGEVLALDDRTRALTDARDTVQHTQEWTIPEPEPPRPAPQDPDPEQIDIGTEPDLPMADLSGLVPETQDDSGPDAEPLTRTRFAPERIAGSELDQLREERDRLWTELQELRDHADRTVVTRDGPEALERQLQVARADNVRLDSEREEIARAADGLVKLLRDRDAALTELLRDRDTMLADRDRLQAEHLAPRAELDRQRGDLVDAAAHRDAGMTEAEIALAQAQEEIARLRQASGEDASRRVEAESNVHRLQTQLAAAADAHEAAALALGRGAEALTMARDAALGRIAELESSLADLTARLAAAESARDASAQAARNDVDALDARHREDTDLIRTLESRCDDAESARDDLARRLAGRDAELEELKPRLSETETTRNELANRLALAQSGREEDARRLAEIEAENGNINNRLASAESEREEGSRRLAAIEAERDDLVHRLTCAESEREDLASRFAAQEAEERTILHVTDAEVRARAVAAEVDAVRAEWEHRLAETSQRLREESDRSERASAELLVARRKIDDLSQELAVSRLSPDVHRPASGKPSAPAPAPAASRDRIEELIQERDQARRDVARLRSMLDYLGTKDPAPG